MHTMLAISIISLCLCLLVTASKHWDLDLALCTPRAIIMAQRLSTTLLPRQWSNSAIQPSHTQNVISLSRCFTTWSCFTLQKMAEPHSSNYLGTVLFLSPATKKSSDDLASMISLWIPVKHPQWQLKMLFIQLLAAQSINVDLPASRAAACPTNLAIRMFGTRSVHFEPFVDATAQRQTTENWRPCPAHTTITTIISITSQVTLG